MMAPLEMYAHIPGLFRAYGGLEQATAKLHHLDKRYKALAELKAAILARLRVLHRHRLPDLQAMGSHR
jgi:hypothetical protein